MITTWRPNAPDQYLLLHNVSWHGYETLLKELELDGRHLRVTYDHGNLEIMTVSHEHEFNSELLSHLILVLSLELNIPIHSGGSTTFKKEVLEKGLEPDKCWWIQNEAKMRGKRRFDIDKDPPPDLAIEVEITRSALDRMSIYAALKIPEVWRCDGEELSVHVLGTNGKYRERQQSRAFPLLPMQKLLTFLKQSESIDQTTLLRSFAKWVREELLPAYQYKQSRKNGK